jgi:hypothetical protein
MAALVDKWRVIFWKCGRNTVFSGKVWHFMASRRCSQRDRSMFATILVGHYLSIQGRLLHRLPGGLVAIRVGSQTLVGRPVPCGRVGHAA